MKKRFTKILCIAMSSIMLIMSLSVNVFAAQTYEQAGPSLTPNVLYTTREYNLSADSAPALGCNSFLYINNTWIGLGTDLVSSNERGLMIIMYEADLNAPEQIKSYAFQFDGRRLGDYVIYEHTMGQIEPLAGVELYLTMQLSYIDGDNGSSGQFFSYSLEQR